jgi:hypothetical protein
MQNFESKSILAKLMATENLTVEQRNVPTASFNVKDRILTVPVLDKNISSQLYDLFMGHEVGHALYTPLEGLERAYNEKISASVCNVIEDVRIERKMKDKYPGLRNSFTKGYRELIEKDFFGTQGAELNDMSLIDRINLFYKGGPILGIKFTETEREILKEIESAETFDDVLILAKKISGVMKDEKEQQKANANPEDAGEDEDLESDYDGFDGDEYQDEWSDEEGADSKEDDELEIEGNQPSSGADEGDEIRSQTDDNYRKNQSKLFADDGKVNIYANLPRYDLDKAILDHKVLWHLHRTDPNPRLNPDAPEKFQSILKENNKVVSYLVKEFELRKNADQLKRASTAKTGDLNMSKIFSYKFNEDIFKKITVLPGGKSHGLVMFLDWSGSMSDHIYNTVKQLLSLVMFCKKVNIPYEVFAFANNDYGNVFQQHKQSPIKNDLVMGDFRLLNMLSSRMSASEFKYAATQLVGMSHYYGYVPHWMSLNSTPMFQAIITAMEYIPVFQNKYKLQVVNTIFLTDGESDRAYGVFGDYTDRDGNSGIRVQDFQALAMQMEGKYITRGEINVTINDPVTREQVKINAYRERESMTEGMIRLLKKRTGCNVLGFYVLSGRQFNRDGVQRFFGMSNNHDEIKAKFRKEKSVVVKNAGFDEYYLLRSEGLDTDADVEFDTNGKTTTRSLVNAFTKYAGNRHSNRVILNRFIGMIA